jgi:hypothetical protein
MKIKSVSMLKYQRGDVWAAVRDRLTEIVPLIDDIDSVTTQSREEGRDGVVRLVNIWRAKPKLPAIAADYLKPNMLAWTDRAEYRRLTFECVWRIEPHFLSDRVKCSGVTRYEQAMGGRGTRVIFEGDLDLVLLNLPGVPAILESPLSSAIETFVSSLVPKNFRKLIEAVGQFLATEPTPVVSGKSKSLRRA